MLPFVVASIILIAAFFALLRADDPVRDRNQSMQQKELIIDSQ